MIIKQYLQTTRGPLLVVRTCLLNVVDLSLLDLIGITYILLISESKSTNLSVIKIYFTTNFTLLRKLLRMFIVKTNERTVLSYKAEAHCSEKFRSFIPLLMVGKTLA